MCMVRFDRNGIKCLLNLPGNGEINAALLDLLGWRWRLAIDYSVMVGNLLSVEAVVVVVLYQPGCH